MVNKAMKMKYLVNLHFPNQKMYDNAVNLGFDKDIWEEKNNNKILIMNGDECYRCKSKLINEEYGICQKCINKDVTFMEQIKNEAKEEYRKLPWWKKIF